MCLYACGTHCLLTYSQTLLQKGAWWEVDLQQPSFVALVRIFNRREGKSKKMIAPHRVVYLDDKRSRLIYFV
jgi:hypothetical protein